MHMSTSYQIISFGEVLWDLLPDGAYLGGAPLNVVLNTHKLGVKSSIISAIGADKWGQKVLDEFKTRSFETPFIQQNSFNTGTVSVRLNQSGSPSYTIHEPAAWDHLKSDENTLNALKGVQYLVMGTLACRNAESRSTLYHYLARFKGKVVFDLNFREPFYNKALVQRLLESVHILKLNDEELGKLKKWFHLKSSIEDQLIELKERFSLEEVLLTLGEKGAYLMDDTHTLFHASRINVTVADTVGAGDAFLAGYLYAKVKDFSSQNSLAFANACGAHVASLKGATPDLNILSIRGLLKAKNEEIKPEEN